mmetsp:Transcript_19350/g.44372  ORF Transcript_19350/g.44372 Transcript_19350/m.44372 type:complete len:253 (-) Transcript_19350:585-1343(-)
MLPVVERIFLVVRLPDFQQELHELVFWNVVQLGEAAALEHLQNAVDLVLASELKRVQTPYDLRRLHIRGAITCKILVLLCLVSFLDTCQLLQFLLCDLSSDVQISMKLISEMNFFLTPLDRLLLVPQHLVHGRNHRHSFHSLVVQFATARNKLLIRLLEHHQTLLQQPVEILPFTKSEMSLLHPQGFAVNKHPVHEVLISTILHHLLWSTVHPSQRHLLHRNLSLLHGCLSRPRVASAQTCHRRAVDRLPIQ